MIGPTFSWITMCQKCRKDAGFGAEHAMNLCGQPGTKTCSFEFWVFIQQPLKTILLALK